LAAGYVVFAINPMQVARYRERHSPSGAKSDAADAHLLAEIVRLDRAHHRPVAGDSELAEHIKVDIAPLQRQGFAAPQSGVDQDANSAAYRVIFAAPGAGAPPQASDMPPPGQSPSAL
jgi:hypothetical protein